MKSIRGPGRSGWSGYLALFFVEGQKNDHIHHARYAHIYNVRENTRTTRTYPDLSLLSGGLRRIQTRTLPGPNRPRPGPNFRGTTILHEHHAGKSNEVDAHRSWRRTAHDGHRSARSRGPPSVSPMAVQGWALAEGFAERTLPAINASVRRITANAIGIEYRRFRDGRFFHRHGADRS